MNDLVGSTLPLVQHEGPETSDWGLFPAQFRHDIIENNYWGLSGNRAGERRDQLLGEISRHLYGDADRWKTLGTAPSPAGLPASTDPRTIPGTDFQMPGQAGIEEMFATLAAVREQMPGEVANLPETYADVLAIAEDYSRSTLRAERDDALGRIDNRSLPNWTGGAASFLGSMAAGVTDVEGVATLPFGFGAGSLPRVILLESLLGGASAALAIPAQPRQADFLGYKAPDPVAQVLGGMAFGAALPIAGRALRLGVNTLTPAGRIENRELLRWGARPDATDTERGAAQTLARDEASREATPDGAADPAHAGRIDDAEAGLLADDPQIVRPGDVIPVDPDTAPAAPGSPPVFDFEPGGNAAPDANQVGYVFGKLLELGATPKDAAALLGNLMQESGRGLNTGAIGDGGNSIGIGQWNGPRRRALQRFAQARGVDWRDLDLQIEYLWRELHGPERPAWDAIRAAPDAAAGARIASERFWRPGIPHLSNRMAFARMVAGQYSGGQVPRGGAPGRWRDPGDDAQASGIVSFDPRDIGVDAAAYQFKMGGDQYGVTERLQGERIWDARAAVGVIVHERLDGSRWIADGHQRLGLARRLMDRGHDPITLQGFLLREIDGVSVEDARALAALRNIRQESGTPLDAAKILRDRPELARELGSRSRPFMAQATALADLAPGPFQAVVNEVIPSNFGAIVGRVIPDDDRMQGVAIAALAKANPANETQAESIVRDIRRLGLERAAENAQLDLFGDGFDLRQTVISERARVIDRVMKDARADRAIFNKLQRDADTIEGAGNVLDRDANTTRADLADQTLARLLILADQPGPVRDAIDAAARALRAGAGLDDAAREVADALGQPAGRAAADGPAGSGDEAAELKAIVDRGGSAEEIAAHPAVRKVLEESDALPRPDLQPGYGTDEFWKSREYSARGQKIVGKPAAVDYLYREARRLAWTEDGLEPPSSVRSERRAVILLGPPAAGKSSIANPWARHMGAAIIDADEAKKIIPEYRGGLGASAVHEESGVIADDVLVQAVVNGDNLVLPKVGGSSPSIERLITRLREDGGYRVDVVLVDTSPAETWRRMIGRFVSTGRIIPPDVMQKGIDGAPRTYETLKQKGSAHGFARIDNSPGLGEPRGIVEDAGGLVPPSLSEPADAGRNGSIGSAALRDAGRENPGGQVRQAGGRVTPHSGQSHSPAPAQSGAGLSAVRPSVGDLPAEGDARIQPGLFDDPVEDAAEAVRLAGIERNLNAALADPEVNPMLRVGPADDAGQLPQEAALRDLLSDLRDEAEFNDALKTICDMKGGRP